ncbi:MAG: hypothetical protein F6J98_43285 [Moorea sp. SIO4G2]|nr:hypothetical protein [Moorena sp. SIO4G2]NEQ81296.1 hypothetical protein [Moorena sp. SIO2I5]
MSWRFITGYVAQHPENFHDLYLTRYLGKNHALIVLAVNHVYWMCHCRKLSQTISESGLIEFKRLVEYKCLWFSASLV